MKERKTFIETESSIRTKQAHSSADGKLVRNHFSVGGGGNLREKKCVVHCIQSVSMGNK